MRWDHNRSRIGFALVRASSSLARAWCSPIVKRASILASAAERSSSSRRRASARANGSSRTSLYAGPRQRSSASLSRRADSLGRRRESWRRPSATRCSNREASVTSAGTSSTYPGARVTIGSGTPASRSRLRTREMVERSAISAPVPSWPLDRESTRRSTDTTRPRSMRRRATSALDFTLPMSTGRPFQAISTGPRTRISKGSARAVSLAPSVPDMLVLPAAAPTAKSVFVGVTLRRRRGTRSRKSAPDGRQAAKANAANCTKSDCNSSASFGLRGRASAASVISPTAATALRTSSSATVTVCSEAAPATRSR